MSTFTSLDENVVLVSFCVYECVKQDFFILFYFKPNLHPTWRSSSLLSQSLTVSEVQGLLGSNLNELKSYENQTLVQSWIRLQPQSQLDRLAIGLTGGTTSATSTASATTFSGTSVTVNANTVTKTAATTTKTTATTTAKTTAVTAAGESCNCFKSLFVHGISISAVSLCFPLL